MDIHGPSYGVFCFLRCLQRLSCPDNDTTHTGEALPDTFSQLHTEYGTMNQAAASAPKKARESDLFTNGNCYFRVGLLDSKTHPDTPRQNMG
jgi:hypothetical protein